ncbi:hypothetical protein ACQHIV_11960 [Kribbella sp. GL6]|uniref:hypothetical protein n=1 Tax=Kribbella sp. GL6 TaxID=3419765 RepID=UPI003D011DC5
MKDLKPFLVLAEAVAEGRLSAGEFMRICLPLFKYTPGRFKSSEHFHAAQDLFFVADDLGESGGDAVGFADGRAGAGEDGGDRRPDAFAAGGVMRQAESFVSLAEAVGDGRLSAAEFKVLCRPLFRFSRCHFLSRAEYVAARDLFFVSDSPTTPQPEAGLA